MKPLKNIFFIATILLAMACDDDDSQEVLTPLDTKTANDIPANPQPPGPPTGAPPDYTFFSFATGEIIADADSSTTRWDIGLSGLSIIVNGGVSGPGSTEAQVLTGLFDEITIAPEDGYVTDTSDSFAIPSGSGNGWYHYNLNGNNVVTPIPGRVIMIKTSDGNYAKFEVLNYYQGSPDVTSQEFFDNRPPGRYYSIKYVFQPNGTRDF